MKIEIIREKNNILLDRKEIEFIVKHEERGTPSRKEVFNQLISKISLDPNKSVLIYLKSSHGKSKSEGLLYYFPKGIIWSTIEPPYRRKVIKDGEEES